MQRSAATGDTAGATRSLCCGGFIVCTIRRQNWTGWRRADDIRWMPSSRSFSTSLPVLALGFTVPTVVTYFALKRLQGLFVHANVDLRLGVLERVVASPFFHHWHHSADPGTWNTNYAGSIPAVDWLFGTLHLPEEWPRSYGCDSEVPDTGYVNRLLSPWTSGKRPAAPIGASPPTDTAG